MRFSAHLFCFIWVLILWFPNRAEAAYSNYNTVLLGERAAGLGGAFTALTDDSAATPYYNPATTVLSNGSSLSATVNVYNKYSTNIGETPAFTEAPQRLSRGYFRSLPSASGTVVNLKSFAVGLSILVPDYEFYSGQMKGNADTTSFLSYVDESLWVGGTFSARLTKVDSIGLSVYYTARDLTRSASDRTIHGTTSATITSEEKNLTANSIVPILGYHRKLSPFWSIGIAYRPHSLPISGEGSYYRSTTETSPYSTTTINQGNLRAITNIPAKLSVGVAREFAGINTVSLDAQFYEGLSYHDFPEFTEGTDAVTHRDIVNVALGFEQFLRPWFSVRLGAFTNYSSHPGADANLPLRQGDAVNMNGFSMNFNVRTEDRTIFTFGGYYNGGSGSSTQLVNQQVTVVPMSQQIFTMLIATGFAF